MDLPRAKLVQFHYVDLIGGLDKPGSGTMRKGMSKLAGPKERGRAEILPVQ